MADLKISDLSALSGGDLVAADELAIVDDSASETKKITVSNLIANGVTLISDDAIPGAKILFGAGDIATAALADSAVTAAKIGADQVTAAKIADNTIVNLVSTLPTSGDYTGQLALDTDDNSLYVYSGTVWLNTKAPSSVNAFTDTTSGIINITTAVSSGTATVTASIDNTASAAQFLAGPVGSGGTVGYRTIDGGDLPTATTTSKGGVIVNGGGLALSTDTIQIDNSVTASSTKHLVTYDANGLITGGSVISSSDLPVATSSAKGAVIVSDGLAVDASGNLSIDNTVTSGTYTKVTVTSKGVVSSGDVLTAADIPDHSAAKLTSGTIGSSLIANDAITAEKLANESTVKFGGALGSDNVTIFPSGDFKGQLFWDETSLDLYVYTGSAFIPITVLSGNLVNAGTYNANTNLVSSITTAGSSAGFAVGSALPAPVGTNLNHYVVVDTSGTGTGAAPSVALAPPDMLLSQGVGTEYSLIDVSNAIAGQTASNISFIASGTIAATDVQAALQEVDTEKLPKAGGTMTGDLNLGTSTNVVFEGSSADDYETTLTVTNPTADRTITFPNVTGTVVTSGDTGSVTSTMIADGAIVNADINASAEIAVSKLANGTARQLLQTDAGGTGVEFTSNVDIPGTLDVTGNSLFDGTLAVAGLLRANGKLQVFAGTPSSVSICQSIGSGDTDTGIYFPTGSGNGIGIASGGAERLFINETGSIGIGGPTTLGPQQVTIKSSHHFAMVLDREGDLPSYIRTNANRSTSGTNIGGSQYLWDGTTVAAIYALSGSDATNKDNGSLAFYTTISGASNTEKMRIDENGNVGIGATNIGSRLEIKNLSSGTAAQARIHINDGRNGQNPDDFEGSGSPFGGAGAGLLMTAFGMNNTNASLTPAIQFGSTDNAFSTTNPKVGAAINASASEAFNADTTGGMNLHFYTTPNNPGTGQSIEERMVIDSSGRLLVGNSSTIPINGLDCALQVEGASTATSRISVINRGNNAEGAGIQIAKSRGTIPHSVAEDDQVGGIFWCAGDGNDFVSQAAKIECFIDALPGGSDTPGRLVFSTTPDQTDTPVERFRIDSYGQHKMLSASGTSTLELRNGTVSGGVHRLLYGLHSATTNANGTPIYSIFTNGTVGTPSDIRLKKNVESTRDGYLNDIANLRVVKYHWKTQEDAEPKELGLIAQEVEEIFPGLIHTEGEGDDEVKEIKRSVLPFMLLKALQEANAKIETLEAKVAALEAS